MTDRGALEAETLMLLLALLVVVFLLGVGTLQYLLTGDPGNLFRNIGIGTILLVFSVGFYRRWSTSDTSHG
ncbi:hypothetical protein DVK02_14785 [Halobellus sp. Atlit-31R]|nr:hypothetical protein DVK02_14785 [Halobellus sp. Atlit-31R]